MDPLHDNSHPKRLLKDLPKLLVEEKIIVNLDLIISAINYHDIYTSSCSTTNNFLIWIWKYIFDGPGSAVMFFVNNKITKNNLKIFYAIWVHSAEGHFIFLRKFTTEAKILSDLDNLDGWSLERIKSLDYLLKNVSKNKKIIKFGLWYYKNILLKKSASKYFYGWSKAKFMIRKKIFTDYVEKLITVYKPFLS